MTPCFRHDNPCVENENCCLVTDLVTLKKTMHLLLDRNKASQDEKKYCEMVVTGIGAHLVRVDEMLDNLQARVACWKRDHPGCCGGIMPTCHESGCMEGIR